MSQQPSSDLGASHTAGDDANPSHSLVSGYLRELRRSAGWGTTSPGSEPRQNAAGQLAADHVTGGDPGRR